MICPTCTESTSRVLRRTKPPSRVLRSAKASHHRVIRDRQCLAKKCGAKFQTIEFLGKIKP